jgi:hypothetical protein
MTTRTVGAISFDGAAVLESEQDVEIARESTLPLIKSLEVFSAGDKKDKRYSALLAKSYGQYAFGFFEEDMIRYRGRDEAAYKKSRARADSFYDRGKNYGLRAVGPEDKVEAQIKRSGKKDLPGLFWTAFCWGNWLNLHKDDPLAIIELPKIQGMVERVVEIDPTYNYGSALSFLGALHSSRPAMLGGNPQKAKEYFDQAMETAPNYLMNKVMAAQYLAVQTQNRRLFVSLLEGVMSSDAAALPEQRLANELAKRRAKLLLERVDNYF